MSKHRSSDKSDRIDDSELRRLLDEGMTSLGWKVPQSESDVMRAEPESAELMDPASLPEALRDPRTVLDHESARQVEDPTLLPLEADQAIEHDLARAAREGGRIPPELEEKLRRDRLEAEREADNA